MSKKNMPSREELQTIDEADLAMDYGRCAARINPLAAIANYKEYHTISNPFDKRAAFIAQQGLLHSSYEDLAQFLHALNKRKTDSKRLQWTLSSDDKNLAQFPNILRSFKISNELLDWLGLDKSQLIKKVRKRSHKSERACKRIIEDRCQDIMQGIESCRTQKLQRQTTYNATKHGKPILSVKPGLLSDIDQASEEDGPHFFYQRDSDPTKPVLRSYSVPFSDDQFDLMTQAIIKIHDVIRDLLYFFLAEFYPDRLSVLQEAYDKQLNLRNEVPNLFN